MIMPLLCSSTLKMEEQCQYQAVSGRCSLPVVIEGKCRYHFMLQHEGCKMADGNLCPNERWSSSSDYCWQHRAQDEETVPRCNHIFTKGPLIDEKCQGLTTSPDSNYCSLHCKRNQ